MFIIKYLGIYYVDLLKFDKFAILYESKIIKYG